MLIRCLEDIRHKQKETKLCTNENVTKMLNATLISVHSGTTEMKWVTAMPPMEGIKIFKHEVCYWPKGFLTFSNSSMLQIIWAQVVKISTARERVRIPYTWEKLQQNPETGVCVYICLSVVRRKTKTSQSWHGIAFPRDGKRHLLTSRRQTSSVIQRLKASRMLELTGINLYM